MKKIVALFLTLVIILSFAACGKDSNDIYMEESISGTIQNAENRVPCDVKVVDHAVYEKGSKPILKVLYEIKNNSDKSMMGQAMCHLTAYQEGKELDEVLSYSISEFGLDDYLSCTQKIQGQASGIFYELFYLSNIDSPVDIEFIGVKERGDNADVFFTTTVELK